MLSSRHIALEEWPVRSLHPTIVISHISGCALSGGSTYLVSVGANESRATSTSRPVVNATRPVQRDADSPSRHDSHYSVRVLDADGIGERFCDPPERRREYTGGWRSYPSGGVTGRWRAIILDMRPALLRSVHRIIQQRPARSTVNETLNRPVTTEYTDLVGKWASA